jgi:hypothetical protein
VVSDHVPLNDGTFAWPKVCCACGQSWPCHTFQRQLQGQSDNRADKMRAQMTVWSLRMLSRPELAFIGAEVSTRLFDWIDGAVAAQEAVDRARRAAQVRAHSAATRFAGHAVTAAGRLMPHGGEWRRMDQPPRPDTQQAMTDLDPTATRTRWPDAAPNRGPVWSRVRRWRLGRDRQSS